MSAVSCIWPGRDMLRDWFFPTDAANIYKRAQELGLPYRVINTAAGDLGAPAVKKYDIQSPIANDKGFPCVLGSKGFRITPLLASAPSNRAGN